MTDGRASGDRPGRQLYGRRKSHALRPTRADFMARLEETWAVPGVARGAPVAGSVTPHALFPRVKEVWLEIGFGGGEHLADLAGRHPDVGLLGSEHYVDGVAKLLSQIERQNLANIRIHAHDARDLMDSLPDASLARVYLLYPDPWPKSRHHKRRFMNAENLATLARIMAPGAELRVASDIPDYIRHSLALVEGSSAPVVKAFAWRATGPQDWREPWPGWQSTRYEQKALREGRQPTYLRFSRR